MRPKNCIGYPFVELSEVDSTNNYAMQQVQAHLAEHGKTWFAHYQNAGKGQRGKTWQARKGENITMSVALETIKHSIKNQFLLSATVALACFDFVKSVHSGDFRIKWPNDLYSSDRKAGGILIENLVQGSAWRFAVAGIGINVNQQEFPKQLKQATSLSLITGRTFDTITLSKQLCNNLQVRWQQFEDMQYNKLLEDYNDCLYKKDEQVLLEHNNRIFKATIRAVEANGDLLVDSNYQTRFSYGSVSWQPGLL